MSFVESDSDPLSPRPDPAPEEAFVAPDDQVFYSEANDLMGIKASSHQDLQRQSYFSRYDVIATIIRENIDEILHIADVGCGSGYGTNILKLHFGSKVYGVELGDRQRHYAEAAYPECVFREEPIPSNDVMVFAGSAQPMSECELSDYIERTKIVLMTIPELSNRFIGPAKKKYQDIHHIHSWMRRHGFLWLLTVSQLDCWVPDFGLGNQHFAVYVRPEVVSDGDESSDERTDL